MRDHRSSPRVTVLRPRSVPAWATWVAAVSVCLLVIFYVGGYFDPWLSDYGLNRQPCLENQLTGRTICGSEARSLCRRLAEPPLQARPEACKDL